MLALSCTMTSSFYNTQDNYYKKMLDLQEKLRKSEEERIRLEERYKLLVHESQNRHQACINKLRIRYLEFLEDQRTKDERNNSLLIALNKIDGSLAFMSAKTERLSTLRKQYETHLLRTYGKSRASESVTADSGLESQHEISNPSPVSLKPIESFAIKSIPLSHAARDLIHSYSGMSGTVALKNDNSDLSNLTLAAPIHRKPNTELQESFDIPWLSEKSRYILKNHSVEAKSSVSSPIRLPFGASKADEGIRDKLSDLSIKSARPIVPMGNLQDLDRYIGNIRQLQAAANFPQSYENEEQSLNEVDHEQNTSGDILNESLSEDGLVTSEARVSKTERRRDFQLKRRDSIFEKNSDEDSANEKEADDKNSIGSCNFLQAVEQYQAANLNDSRQLIEQNRRLLSLNSDSLAFKEEECLIQSTQPVDTQESETKDSANVFGNVHDEDNKNEVDIDDDEGGEGDGIEDDYDDTVDIDSWHPPEEEREEAADEELELRQANRIRRTLESIEEVEQLEDDEDVSTTAEQPFTAAASLNDQPLETLETYMDEKQEMYSPIEEKPVDMDQQLQEPTDDQYDYSAEPGDDRYQYQYAGYDNQQYAYDYSSDQYQQQPYDPNMQYYQPQQQAYDESGYALNADYTAYDEVEPVNYNSQGQSYGADFPDLSPERPEAVPGQASVILDSRENKKKDVIKSILDSDSESFIERNLSNTESDFDFN